MITTNDSFCFPGFFFIVFWTASLSVIPVTPVSAESASFIKEIEILEDEIMFALTETTSEKHAIHDMLINGTCPKHFRDYFLRTFDCLDINNGCYCIITEDKNWWSALQYCRQYGMELLSLETKEEENNLAKRLVARTDKRNRYYLTSGNRLHGNRTTWMWAGTGDILSLETREITWQRGEPSRSIKGVQEECLIWVLSFNQTFPIHEWNDLSCDNSFYQFICEFSTTFRLNFKN